MTANDVYQLIVGEIGLPRREFLYDIRFWEARRIIRGYIRRDRISKELQRLTAFCVYFTLRKNEKHETPSQWMTLPWETGEEGQAVEEISDQEIERLRRLMAEENAKAEISKPAQ